MKSQPVKLLCASSIFSCCIISVATQAADTVSCAKRTDLAGSCYQVHGRLNAWNGNPTERIWIIGTKRMLGVSTPDTGDDLMPPGLHDQLGSFWTRIYADFTVCPFDKDRPRHLRNVCIESAKNVLVERHTDGDGKDKGTFTTVPDIKSE